jgi:hypothetical protein
MIWSSWKVKRSFWFVSEIGNGTCDMIPVGYMAKQVAQRPGWLEAPEVKDIYSVSNCVSHDFADYIKFWRHNGYWLFDNPGVITELLQKHSIAVEPLTFFYYEAYEKQFDEEHKQWSSFIPSDFPTKVTPPKNKQLHGFDVVTFSVGTNPECSPLSCNHLASEMRTNIHCLFESFEETKHSLESGRFDNAEPGPFRIFAIHTIDPEHWLDDNS